MWNLSESSKDSAKKKLPNQTEQHSILYYSLVPTDNTHRLLIFVIFRSLMIDSCGVTSHSRASLRDVWPLGCPKTILLYLSYFINVSCAPQRTNIQKLCCYRKNEDLPGYVTIYLFATRWSPSIQRIIPEEKDTKVNCFHTIAQYPAVPGNTPSTPINLPSTPQYHPVPSSNQQ